MKIISKYRIISFDGGGVKGVLTARLLKRLAEEIPELLKLTDLFAGTSTGSFIALALAYGKTAEDVVNMYSLENLESIFSFPRINLLIPRYDNDNLKAILNNIFPQELTLKGLNKKVVIPSFKIFNDKYNNWCPTFFNNFPNSENANTSVLDVALASSAAPTYFPSHNNYIDGGVVINNPSTSALAFAKDSQAGDQMLDNISLLSIGTGFSNNKITEDTENWGIIQWTFNPFSPTSFPLLEILLDGATEVDVYFLSQLLGDNYFRLNPTLVNHIDLDDYEKVPDLIELAEKEDLTPVINWIKENWL
ncbi:patatin-like phospholipase family protein [Orenia marismortui]|uniref:patatin-like phospholipase family protein n=1 Tax=Orenia marismortui TaxID=46469 RepID=UPI00037CDBB6|nr:patatin-like phospholipase family protein [Orenia marismortui]